MLDGAQFYTPSTHGVTIKLLDGFGWRNFMGLTSQLIICTAGPVSAGEEGHPAGDHADWRLPGFGSTFHVEKED